jgi:hypothetical protein
MEKLLQADFPQPEIYQPVTFEYPEEKELKNEYALWRK